MSLFQGSASKEVSEGKEQVASHQGKQAIDDSGLSLNDSHVLQGNAPERSTDMQVSVPGQEQKPITQLYTSKRRSRKSTKHNKPLLLKVKVADKKISGVCKSCGLEQGMDCIICRLCNAVFHSQCLGILPANLQEGEWCCPSCAVNEKEINEKLALRSDETPKELHKTTGKTGVCEACKKQDDNVLRCDGCEAAYHVNCIIPATVIFPDDSWYCPKCAEDHRSPLKDVHEKDSPPDLSQGHNCSVCTRVPKVSPLPADIPEHPSPVPGGEAAEKSVEPAAAEEVNVPGSPAASTDMEPPEPRFLLGNENVCKACGAECTKLKSKASCSFCLNRFHLSCLRPPLKKAPRNTWYCPSCLCRVCKIDADDDKILLCDTCDDGYHTYCLNPPVEERPKGAWFCPSCAKSDVPNSPSPKQSEVSKRKRKSTEPRRST